MHCTILKNCRHDDFGRVYHVGAETCYCTRATLTAHHDLTSQRFASCRAQVQLVAVFLMLRDIAIWPHHAMGFLYDYATQSGSEITRCIPGSSLWKRWTFKIWIVTICKEISIERKVTKLLLLLLLLLLPPSLSLVSTTLTSPGFSGSSSSCSGSWRHGWKTETPV